MKKEKTIEEYIEGKLMNMCKTCSEDNKNIRNFENANLARIRKTAKTISHFIKVKYKKMEKL
jgi:hypothetical protein